MNSPAPSPPRRVFKGWVWVVLYTVYWGIALLAVNETLLPLTVGRPWGWLVPAASLLLAPVLGWLSSFTTVKARRFR